MKLPFLQKLTSREADCMRVHHMLMAAKASEDVGQKKKVAGKNLCSP